jgi:hypothetical protein
MEELRGKKRKWVMDMGSIYIRNSWLIRMGSSMPFSTIFSPVHGLIGISPIHGQLTVAIRGQILKLLVIIIPVNPVTAVQLTSMNYRTASLLQVSGTI